MEETSIQTQPQVKLSDRERQILLLAAKGHTDHAIAQTLGISFATVGTYWGRIRGKLGPFNRTELVARFLRSRATVAVDQLKTQNAELVAELDRRNQETSELKVSLDFIQSLLQSAPDAILVVDDEGFIRVSNDAAEELFGYEKGELVGAHVRKLVPDKFQQDHDSHRKEYMSHPTRRRMGEHYGTPARRKDGTEFQSVIMLNMSQSAGKSLITCIVRQITAEENTLLELRAGVAQ